VLMETTYKAGGPAKPDFWPRPASRHNSGSANSRQFSGSLGSRSDSFLQWLSRNQQK
jgi:hypothetical protein